MTNKITENNPADPKIEAKEAQSVEENAKKTRTQVETITTSKKSDKNGYDEDGYDEDGYNREGFNGMGLHEITGTEYDLDGFDKDGFNEDGYNEEGVDCDGRYEGEPSDEDEEFDDDDEFDDGEDENELDPSDPDNYHSNFEGGFTFDGDDF